MSKAPGSRPRKTARRPRPARRRWKRLAPAGAKIAAAFGEAIEEIRPASPPEKRLTVRTCTADFTPRPYGPDDVRRVRDLLGLSQVLFARFLGVDPNTVRSWEQGTRPPSPIARRFLGEIEADPQHWRGRLMQGAAEG